MTATFWLTTAQTVVFLAVVGWAVWAGNRLESAVQEVQAVGDDNQQMRDDIREMADVLRAYWQRMHDTTPATEPIRVPETQPQAEVMGRVDDMTLAWELARLEQIMRGDLKPSPRRRKA